MDFVSVDLETTGFSYSVDEIIEIGAWLFQDGVAKQRFSRLVKPSRYLPTNIQQITGITDAMLANEESIDKVLPEFVDFCGDYPFIGYNLPFDYGFLTFKSKVFGFDITLGGKRRGIDVLKVVRARGNFPSNKLSDVCKYLNISIGSALHRADVDAYATKLVLDRYPGVEPTYIDNTKYGTPISSDTLDLR